MLPAQPPPPSSAQSGITPFHIPAGMGKSCFVMTEIIKANLHGNGGVILDLEGAFPPPEQQLAQQYSSDFTPLQCLAECIRRITEKVDGNPRMGLLLAAYLLCEMGVECSVRRVSTTKRNKPLVPEKKPRPRWDRVFVKQVERHLILSTSLGCIDDKVNFAETTPALFARLGVQGRYGPPQIQLMSIREIAGEMRDLLSESAIGWWRRPHLLAEAREELELAWMQCQTSKVERHTHRRL